MSGSRRPMAVNLASGGKHWTKAEIEERTATEASVPKPLTCPKWLSPAAAKLFRAYAKELISSGLPVSKLDTGTLARLCDAEWSYSEASRQRLPISPLRGKSWNRRRLIGRHLRLYPSLPGTA